MQIEINQCIQWVNNIPPRESPPPLVGGGRICKHLKFLIPLIDHIIFFLNGKSWLSA